MLRNKVTAKIKKDRKNNIVKKYAEFEEKNEVGATYKMAKQQAGWKSTTTPISFLVDGTAVTDPQKLADIQLQCFKDKSRKLIENIPQSNYDPISSLRESMDKWTSKDDREPLTFKQIQIKDTIKIINKLGNNKICCP